MMKKRCGLVHQIGISRVVCLILKLLAMRPRIALGHLSLELSKVGRRRTHPLQPEEQEAGQENHHRAGSELGQRISGQDQHLVFSSFPMTVEDLGQHTNRQLQPKVVQCRNQQCCNCHSQDCGIQCSYISKKCHQWVLSRKGKQDVHEHTNNGNRHSCLFVFSRIFFSQKERIKPV